MYSTALDTKKNATPDHHQTRPSPKTPASGIPSPYVISGMQVPGQAPGNWNTRLSHCCDDPANCVITCFCPCITFGQIAEIVNKGSTSCCENAVIYGLFSLFGLACLYSCMYRSKMRIQYDLEEEPCSDCLVHFCCETCALCQEHRELNKRGFDMGIGWEANMDRQRRGRVTGVTTTAPIVSSPMTR